MERIDRQRRVAFQEIRSLHKSVPFLRILLDMGDQIMEIRADILQSLERLPGFQFDFQPYGQRGFDLFGDLVGQEEVQLFGLNGF